MATIDDFVNHRWEDARTTLRKLDSSFFDRIVNLESRDRGDFVQPVARRRLSKNWHELLEACWDLPIWASNVETAGLCLTTDLLNSNLTLEGKGQFGVYHMTSLVIHLNSLFESIRLIIKRTNKIYVSDVEVRKELNEKYIDQVDALRDRLVTMRNEFAHGYGSVGAWSITRDNVWEGFIAKGFTFKLMNEDHYRENGLTMTSGDPYAITKEIQTVFDGLGAFLSGLEQDIANQNASASASH